MRYVTSLVSGDTVTLLISPQPSSERRRSGTACPSHRVRVRGSQHDLQGRQAGMAQVRGWHVTAMLEAHNGNVSAAANRAAWTDEASSESSSVSGEIATDGVKLRQLRECHADAVERLLRRRIRAGTSGVGVNLEKDSIDPCADCSPRQQRRQRAIASGGVSRRS